MPVAVQTRRNPDLVRRVNAHIATLLPQLTYTVLAVINGVGDHPMLVHTHPNDDSPLTGESPYVIFRGENCLPVPCFVQMGLVVLHGSVGGVIYYGDTLWILNVGLCLTLLGPTCLCRGRDSALCWYCTQVLPRGVCLWRCRMNCSGLASQSEDDFLCIASCMRG